MTIGVPPPGGARHLAARRRVPVGLFGLFGILATVLVLVALSEDPGPPPSPPAPLASASAPAPTRTQLPAADSRGAAGGASTPVSVSIPSIAVASDLVRLGIKEDRTVEVPEDAGQAGWYERGTSPGQPGSAVILGHVDSTEGPAVFYRLRELDRGAHVLVTLADGTTETFEVTRLETIRNDEFPAQRIYAGTPRRPTLALVTCGGEYDADRGGYQSNVIAYTEHVGTSPVG